MAVQKKLRLVRPIRVSLIHAKDVKVKHAKLAKDVRPVRPKLASHKVVRQLLVNHNAASQTAIVTVMTKNSIMFIPKRICIPFGMSCNFLCTYCYRDRNRTLVPIIPTDKFLSYMKNLSNETYAVIASGGEPLLYWDTIKKIFELVPSRIHKKIMTNGSLLNEQLVDYFNTYDIEVSLSHDGICTEKLRGQDIFKNKKILNLVKKIKNLHIVPVITNQNEDVLEIYNYIQQTLNRSFYFSPSPIIPTGYNNSLIDNFDYDTFERSLIELNSIKISTPSEWYRKPNSGMGINILLDGSVVGQNTLNKYGTIWDTKDTILKNFNIQEKENISYCKNSICRIRDICDMNKTNSCEHTCKIRKIQIDTANFINNGELEYV